MRLQDSTIHNVHNIMPSTQDFSVLSGKLIESSVKLGCERAVVIPTETIVVRRWVQLKCKYGCEDYGKKLTCPPHSPSFEEMKEILQEYDKALLIHGRMSWQMRYVTAQIEKEAFTLGFYKAFGLGAGPCKLCDNCETSSACIRPADARPSMEACGIDVFETVRNHNLAIKTLQNEQDEANIYGLVLLE